MDTTVGYQHTAVKVEAREGGRYNRAVGGYFNVSCLMESYVSAYPFASTMNLLLGSIG